MLFSLAYFARANWIAYWFAKVGDPSFKLTCLRPYGATGITYFLSISAQSSGGYWVTFIVFPKNLS